MRKEAPRADHQERSYRAALPCERIQRAPRPGGSPFARAESATFTLKTTIAPKIDLEGVRAVRWDDLADDIATNAGKTVATASGEKKGESQINSGISQKHNFSRIVEPGEEY